MRSNRNGCFVEFAGRLQDWIDISPTRNRFAPVSRSRAVHQEQGLFFYRWRILARVGCNRLGARQRGVPIVAFATLRRREITAFDVRIDVRIERSDPEASEVAITAMDELLRRSGAKRIRRVSGNA